MVDWTSVGSVGTGLPEVFFYLVGHLGSVVALTDATGDVVERYAYEPYGQTVIADASGAPRSASAYGNPYAWTGQRYDADNQLYLFYFRTYSPQLGRWLQRDPLGYVDGLNLYEIVRGRPMSLVDPTGLATVLQWLIGMGPEVNAARDRLEDIAEKVREKGGTKNQILAAQLDNTVAQFDIDDYNSQVQWGQGVVAVAASIPVMMVTGGIVGPWALAGMPATFAGAVVGQATTWAIAGGVGSAYGTAFVGGSWEAVLQSGIYGAAGGAIVGGTFGAIRYVTSPAVGAGVASSGVAAESGSPNVRILTPVTDPAPPVYEVGHPGKLVKDHILARAAGGHATDPANLRTIPWEMNARKGALEGQFLQYEAELVRGGMTPAQARAVTASEWQALQRDALPRPMDPCVMDQIPSPGSR